MKTIRCGIIGATVLAGLIGVARGEPASPPRMTGHVLLLENQRVLEGDVEREGDRYRLRRRQSEAWVPADQVLRLCADLDDAYRFLRSRTNVRDADERLKLARWCQLHGLREQGVSETKAALELRPQSAEAQRLLRSLTRAIANAAAPPEPPPPAATPTPAPGPTLSIHLTTEALTLFSRRVQPILMNTCAGCHAADQGGAFQLIRITEDGSQNRRSTQQNLAAVLAHVHLDHWPASPLLLKAVSVHGDSGQAPLKNRDMPAYRTLEDWVQLAAANAPQRDSVASLSLPAAKTTSTPPAQASTPTSPQASANPLPEKPPTPEAWAVARDKPAGASADAENKKTAEVENQSPPTTGADIPPTAEPADPFDPLLFNRQMHPQRDR